MKPKCYRTLQEVREDLNILKLKRDISLAELEHSKLALESSLRPLNIIVHLGKTLKRYGFLYLLRKLRK